MSVIGQTLGRMAHRIGGQLMLELPDDLDPTFIAGLLEGANAEIPASPSFALFVREKRQDADAIAPRVDFRELAMYRQGTHLALAFASDNRGMSTYSSVYPLLLSNGFPSTDTVTGGTGVAGLHDFSATLAEVLVERHGTYGVQDDQFREAIHRVVSFLAEAYEAVGNGQASFATDWWVHVQQWVVSLEQAAVNRYPRGIPALYGCAGLPVPADGTALSMAPKQYIKVLQDRWSTPNAIGAEVARLANVETASKAASLLAKVDWDESFTRTSLRSDSIVALVALSVARAPLDRMSGWAALSEADFKDSYVDAKGKLRVLRHGIELQSPWKNAPSVLVAAATDPVDQQAGTFELEDVELIVPPSSRRAPEGLGTGSPALAQDVCIQGTRGCAASFAVESEQLLPDGLHLRGRLTFTVAKKARNSVSVEITTRAGASLHLVDKCDASFLVLRTDEAALWARPQGRTNKGSLRGPVVWSRSDGDSPAVDLPLPGAYELAVAWGEASGVEKEAALARNQPFNVPWVGLEDNGAKAIVDVVDAMEVACRGTVLFQLELGSSEERPLSPIVAAARGLQPDTSQLVGEGAFAYLEAQLGECLFLLDEGHVLGAVLATDAREKSDLVIRADGFWCTPDLVHKTGNELSPGFPSEALLALPAYESLRKAYLALRIPELIEAAESEGGGAGLTISRVALDSIPRQAVDDLLRSYQELLGESSTLAPSDAFWAKNPFSIALFHEGAGYQSANAILLSPLHPLRLAWAWALQVGLRQAYDDGAGAAEALALLDGTNLPAFVQYQDQFESPIPLMPVRIDGRPGDLYVGWHASVKVVDNQVALPAWIAGRPFPVDGLSALSSVSVRGAIDDFLRVSPQVQSLHIELASTHPAPRSSSIDDGILAKIGELASSSLGLDGVAGVRVTDSETRLGPIPGFDPINNALAIARPGFNVEWVSVPEALPTASHVTFVEGTTALLAMEPTKPSRNGWLGVLPLRRTPARSRGTTFTRLDYSLAAPGPDAGELEKALHGYESVGTTAYALKMIPNPVGVAGKPGWLVAGDFGVDPRGLSRAARDHADSNYILWDWRPATTIKADRQLSSRAQPYFVLASVPPALNTAIHVRLKQLNSKLTAVEVEARTRHLVSTLAERAIGLNTLLSIGHHQATGALGFFFALESIGTWLASTPPGEIRLVIPVDAVDPFLRASNKAAGDSRRRADLLVVRAFVADGAQPSVVLVPVEIKHYGLADAEREKSFPLAGEARLEEHAGQLQAYQAQLQSLCETYREATGSHASLLGQRLAAVLDAALQLGPRYDAGAAALLGKVASGSARVALGKGVLLWYQAGGSAIDGAKASWDEVPGGASNIRNDVRVDPAAFDECFWSQEEGLAHHVVRESLEDASRIEATEKAVKAVAAPEPQHRGRAQPSLPSSTRPLENPAPASISPRPPANTAGAGSSHKVAPSAVVPSPSPTRDKLQPIELEKRYARILAAFGEFNVKVERPRGEVPYQEGPAFVEYAVFPSYGVSVNKIESKLDDLKLRLRLPADGEIGCSTHRGNVLLTVPKSDEDRYFVDAEELWSRWDRPSAGFRIPVGEDAAGNVVEIDLSNSNSPHLLIAGVTGSGKSEALLTILHGAARFYEPQELRLRLIDPKQTELNTLADLPHTQGAIGWSGEEAITILEEAVDEMEERYKAFRQAGPTIRNISEYQMQVGPMARWIIVLDEYADLISDDNERKRIEKCLQRLSQKARAAGLHVVVSTQKPVVQVVNTVVKGNLPGKIALRVNTAMESRVILDEAGAEKLVGKGDALIRAGNEVIRIQFARYSI